MRYVFLTAILLSFATLATAQSCGTFGVTLNVHDNDLKPVAGYTIKTKAWLKDELKGKTFTPVADKPGTSEMQLTESDRVSGNYGLTITAPGFIATEKTIAFANCTRASYDILLLKKGEKYRVASGHIEDNDARSISYATVAFTNADGVSRSVSTDFIGNYEIKLKPGKYTMTVTKTSFQPFETKKFLVPADGAVKFNAVLMFK